MGSLTGATELATFVARNFKHFNAQAVTGAIRGCRRHLAAGGEVILTLGGAMSTAEIGLSAASLIRAGRVHAVVCTGANLEEDIFNLIARYQYIHLPAYRQLSARDEHRLFSLALNRVTDTCIPDNVIWERLEMPFLDLWTKADRKRKRYFPYEYCYAALRQKRVRREFQFTPRNSWVHAAMLRNLPIFTPGWEDSALGNMYAGACLRGIVSNPQVVRSGIETAIALRDWAAGQAPTGNLGLLSIGSGISREFPRGALREMLGPRGWSFSCVITDRSDSYGPHRMSSLPSETSSIPDAPRRGYYTINSDATIVAPLIFAILAG